jgi:hypothetical protein
MSKPTGIILYEGPSRLDGEPIVVIATLESRNRKTGSMVQTWIMRSDLDPVAASISGRDASVCGKCPHRHSLNGACYVRLNQAPLAVYKAYTRGSYTRGVDLRRYLQGRAIRLGAYGDPAAAPAGLWRTLRSVAVMTTGYTHQLDHSQFDPDLLDVCMVSVDTPKQATRARELGVRTFRVKMPGAPRLAGEEVCRAESAEQQCITCGLCSGARQPGPSVVIDVHGAVASRYADKFGRVNLIAVA